MGEIGLGWMVRQEGVNLYERSKTICSLSTRLDILRKEVGM